MPRWAVEELIRTASRRVAERHRLNIEANNFGDLKPSAQQDVMDWIAEQLTDDPLSLIATWDQVKRAFGRIDPAMIDEGLSHIN
jgi:hypothetical protein